jgi:hypothetical protein
MNKINTKAYEVFSEYRVCIMVPLPFPPPISEGYSQSSQYSVFSFDRSLVMAGK